MPPSLYQKTCYNAYEIAFKLIKEGVSLINTIKEELGSLGLDAEEVTTERGIEFRIKKEPFYNPWKDPEMNGLEAGIESLIYDLQETLDLDFDYRIECGFVFLIPLI